MEKQPEPQTADGDFDKGDTLILEEDNARKSAFEALFTTFQTKFQEEEGLQPANQIILRSFVFAKSEVDGFQALAQLNLQIIDLDTNPSLDQYSHFLRLEVECIKRRSEMSRSLRKIITLTDEMIEMEKKIRTEYGAELDQLSTEVKQLFDERTALVRKRLARIKDQCSKVIANARR
ncbi:hypothetical protein D6C97_05542 [Aureobasidium pullulans]|nr:hypothetical protein D6C97_05542 [Aureobasidium pullulans]